MSCFCLVTLLLVIPADMFNFKSCLLACLRLSATFKHMYDDPDPSLSFNPSKQQVMLTFILHCGGIKYAQTAVRVTLYLTSGVFLLYSCRKHTKHM